MRARTWRKSGKPSPTTVRDRIVFTYGHTRVREKLLGTDELTLEKAIEICRSAEATRDRMQTMSDVKSASAIHSIRHDNSSPGTDPHHSKSRVADDDSGGRCGNCGRSHEPKQCPAFDQKCSNCHRRGHFAKCCRKPNRRQRSSSRGPPKRVTSGSGTTRSVNMLGDAVETHRSVLSFVRLPSTTH